VIVPGGLLLLLLLELRGHRHSILLMMLLELRLLLVWHIVVLLFGLVLHTAVEVLVATVKVVVVLLGCKCLGGTVLLLVVVVLVLWARDKLVRLVSEMVLLGLESLLLLLHW
jgi:hypothetical protein